MTAAETPENARGEARRRVQAVFWAFLRLGLTSFGGPIAHIGYFREEFVVRRGWLNDREFGDLAGLCQFLPGPASSQLGFAIGLKHGGGLPGGIAAWVAFTLPSAVLLVAFAAASATFASQPLAVGAIHGLKLVAVAVVAQAVFGMARVLTPDGRRGAIALLAVVIAAFLGSATAQIGTIAVGAALGLWLCRAGEAAAPGEVKMPVSQRGGVVSLAGFALLLVVALLPASDSVVGFFGAFFRSGALVFGGGHVVLPLLKEATVPHWVANSEFLSGYGLAQAMPGPLFAFSAWLGFLSRPFGGVAGATLALVAIFLPGLLLIYGVLPIWSGLRHRVEMQAAMRGANAAVVGILAAALYDPLWVGSVADKPDFAIALAGFLALVVWRLPSWLVVVLLAAAGVGRAAAGI